MKKTLFISLIMLLAISSYSKTTTWLGVTSTEWDEPTNWDNGLPVDGDDVFIDKTGTFSPVIDGTTAAISLYELNITSGDMLTISSNSLSITYRAYVYGTLKIETGGVITTDWMKNYTGAILYNEGVITGGLLINAGDAYSTEGIFDVQVNDETTNLMHLLGSTAVVFKKTFLVKGSLTIPSGAVVVFETEMKISAGKTATVDSPSAIANISNFGILNINSPITTAIIYNKDTGVINLSSNVIGSLSSSGVINFPNRAIATTSISKVLTVESNVTFPTGSETIIGAINLNTGIIATIEADARVKLTGDSGYCLNNGGTFIIESTGLADDKTGQLITEDIVSGAGIFEVQRFIDTSTNRWQLVSSPVVGEKSEVFEGHFLNEYVEGVGVGKGEFSPITVIDRNLDKGEGFAVKFDGTKAGLPGMPNPIVFSKVFTTDDVGVNLKKGDGNTYFDLPEGFNLVGNPYPSNLDWDAVKSANAGIDNALYYYVDNGAVEDPNNGDGNGIDGNGVDGWQTYIAGSGGNNQQISIGQGFGVVISGNSADMILNIPNSARTFDASNGFNKKADAKTNYFELDAVANKLIDKIYFKENANATVNFDSEYDAYKLNSFGNSPVSSLISADNKKLAICETPEVETINMGFNMAIDGKVVFSLKDVKGYSEIILEDKVTNTFKDLLLNDYTFDYSSNEDEFGRFVLHLNRGALSDDINIMNNLKVYSYNNKIAIKSSTRLKNVEVTICNIKGQIVQSEYFSNLKEEEISTNINPGIYMINVKSDLGNISIKVVF